MNTGIKLAIIFATLSSCDRGMVEPIQQGEYIYYNKLAQPLRFELYKTDSNSSIEYVLKANDSITFVVKGDVLAFPFNDTEIENRTGDKVILRFDDGTCTTYVRNRDSGLLDGTGFFNLPLYENYSQELVNQKSYTLRYFINQKDHLLSVNCD